MKKALLLAPMGSVHRRFNSANIDALKELGYEVHLLANFNNGDGPESRNEEYALDCSSKGIITHSIPFVRHSLLKNLKYVKEIKKVLKSEQFDIVHVHTETGGLLLRLSVSSVQKATKLFYTPHGMSFYKGSSLTSKLIYKPIEKWICKKMDCSLPMNSEEKNWLDKWKCNNSFVHGVGLDLTRFANVSHNKEYLLANFKIPVNNMTIVSVGELDDNKNHKIIIDAISKLKSKERINYLLCGVGPLESKLREYAREKKVNLTLAGFRYDVPQIIASCDLFAFPSHHEGLPVSLMEAMACGAPIVASKIRGNVDLIDDDVNGYVIDGDSADGYADKIESLLSDKKKMKDFSSMNLSTIKNYSYDSVKKELFDIYAK